MINNIKHWAEANKLEKLRSGNSMVLTRQHALPASQNISHLRGKCQQGPHVSCLASPLPLYSHTRKSSYCPACHSIPYSRRLTCIGYFLAHQKKKKKKQPSWCVCREKRIGKGSKTEGQTWSSSATGEHLGGLWEPLLASQTASLTRHSLQSPQESWPSPLSSLLLSTKIIK